jgi:hypothetical protein
MEIASFKALRIIAIKASCDFHILEKISYLLATLTKCWPGRSLNLY